jgi:hypothetical protein
MPLFRSERELRQYVTKYVAWYLPSTLRQPGAVTHYARVEDIEVLRRSQIPTPWETLRTVQTPCIVYSLQELLPLPRPIVNMSKDGQGERFSTHRWTTKLALDRARDLTELFLETEAEWRLYESLRASGTEFRLIASRPRFAQGNYQPGRTWFMGPGGRAQYRGAAGFLVRGSGTDIFIAGPVNVADRLRAKREL